MTTSTVDHFLAEHQRHNDVFAQDALNQQRRQALDLFAQQGIPHQRMENWKYTSLQKLEKHLFSWQQDFSQPTQEQLQQARLQEMDNLELVFVNGIFAPEYSSKELLDGCTVIPLSQALHEHPEQIIDIASQSNASDNFNNSFLSLNTAFIQQGCFIDIANGIEAKKAIHLIYLSGLASEPTASQPRNIISVGKNSEATVIESYIGLDDSDYFTNTITNIVLKENAQLQHYKIQEEGKQAVHIGAIYTEQGRDSRLSTHSIDLGALLCRNDIFSSLAAPGTALSMNGLYMLDSKQHIDNHSLVNHCVPHTYSEQNYRGIVTGRGRAVFNGKVVVHKDAQKTEAHQSNANLLLSKHAEVDTKPELEIYADDVKCSHGATVGQLDNHMLFYLRSRAIDEDTAKSLLTFAFAEEVINRIQIQAIRNRLEHRVIGKLPDSELIQEFTDE